MFNQFSNLIEHVIDQLFSWNTLLGIENFGKSINSLDSSNRWTKESTYVNSAQAKAECFDRIIEQMISKLPGEETFVLFCVFHFKPPGKEILKTEWKRQQNPQRSQTCADQTQTNS